MSNCLRGLWAWGCVLASLASAGRAGTVEVRNGGFELDVDGNGAPDVWSAPPSGEGGLVKLDREIRKEGGASLRFETTSPVIQKNANQPVRLHPGALYRASAWVKTQGITVQNPRRLAAMLGVWVDGGPVIEIGENHVGTTDWVKTTVDFVAPAGGRARVYLIFARIAGVKGVAWFDDVQIELLAPAGQLGALDEPPRGMQCRVEWALQRKPPDWDVAVAGLEALYRDHPEVQHVDRARMADYHKSLAAALEARPALKPRLARFYAEHARAMHPDHLAPERVAPLLDAAMANAAKDPKWAPLARPARLALARVNALRAGDTLEVVKAVQQAMGSDPGLQRQVVGALLGDAAALAKAGHGERARRLYDVAIETVRDDDGLRASVEVARLEFLAAAGDAKAARGAGETLVASERKVSADVRRRALLALARLDLDAAEAPQGGAWAARAETLLADNRPALASFLLEHAKALAAKGQWAAAEAQCERVVAVIPEQPATCFEAQSLLVEALMKQRSFDKAIAAAKVLYGASPNAEKEITEAVNLVMRALKVRYRSIALANDFVAFQSNGPNGKDGQRGTEDDVENPLAKVQYTPPAAIEALFKKTLEGLRADFGGRRSRGYLYFYWGKPGEALKEFVARYDACPLEQKAIDQCIDDLVVALKAHCGHTLAGEQFMDYQKYGPKGKDGKLGTEDDLQDPIREILKAMR